MTRLRKLRKQQNREASAPCFLLQMQAVRPAVTHVESMRGARGWAPDVATSVETVGATARGPG